MKRSAFHHDINATRLNKKKINEFNGLQEKCFRSSLKRICLSPLLVTKSGHWAQVLLNFPLMCCQSSVVSSETQAVQQSVSRALVISCGPLVPIGFGSIDVGVDAAKVGMRWCDDDAPPCWLPCRSVVVCRYPASGETFFVNGRSATHCRSCHVAPAGLLSVELKCSRRFLRAVSAVWHAGSWPL